MSAPPRLPVEEVGVACVRAALEAAARLEEAWTGETIATDLDHDHVRAALVSECLFRIDGAPSGGGFAAGGVAAAVRTPGRVARRTGGRRSGERAPDRPRPPRRRRPATTALCEMFG